MRSLILAASARVSRAGPALALQEPTPGKLDSRMVTAAYDPAQVYAVHVPQGQTLAITLAPNEIATDGFGGDGKTLRADLSGNTRAALERRYAGCAPRSMFIRSRTVDGKDPDLCASGGHPPPDQAAVSFTFTYPADEPRRRLRAMAHRSWPIGSRKQRQAALAAASGACGQQRSLCAAGQGAGGLGSAADARGVRQRHRHAFPFPRCDAGADHLRRQPGRQRGRRGADLQQPDRRGHSPPVSRGCSIFETVTRCCVSSTGLSIRSASAEVTGTISPDVERLTKGRLNERPTADLWPHGAS